MRRLQAAIFLLWYLISFAGLDIHRDLEHGHTYVVPAVLAQSCEMIHPHQHCHDHDAAAHGECEEDEDCCSDDFESATITATDYEATDHIVLPARTIPASILQAVIAPEVNTVRYCAHRHGPPPIQPSPIKLFCAMKA